MDTTPWSLVSLHGTGLEGWDGMGQHGWTHGTISACEFLAGIGGGMWVGIYYEGKSLYYAGTWMGKRGWGILFPLYL